MTMPDTTETRDVEFPLRLEGRADFHRPTIQDGGLGFYSAIDGQLDVDTAAFLREQKAEIERLSRELLEAKEVALRYQTIAGKQGNMLMRKSLLLEMAMAYIEYDEAEFLVSEAASIIRYGIENPGEPLPWPSSPGLQKWLVGKGRSNCDGHIGMRLTMQIADGVTVNDRSALSPKKDSDTEVSRERETG